MSTRTPLFEAPATATGYRSGRHHPPDRFGYIGLRSPYAMVAGPRRLEQIPCGPFPSTARAFEHQHQTERFRAEWTRAARQCGVAVDLRSENLDGFGTEIDLDSHPHPTRTSPNGNLYQGIRYDPKAVPVRLANLPVGHEPHESHVSECVRRASQP